MKCIKLSLYSTSKELISEEVICPLSELTKYMIKHEQNVALFPVKYFNKAKGYFENKKTLADKIESRQISPFWMYILPKEELVFGKYSWVQVEHQKCHHFLTNTEFFCETCEQWCPCPYCHEDALGFDEPHAIRFSKIRCITCQQEKALSDVNCD